MKFKSTSLLKMFCGISALAGALPAISAIYRCTGKFTNNGITQTVSYPFGFSGGLPICDCLLEVENPPNRMWGVVRARNAADVLIGGDAKILGTAGGNHPWQVSSCYLETISN